jgi:uncharacterized protein (DUF1501 family)
MEPLTRRTFLKVGALSTFSLLAPWRTAWADDEPAGSKPGAIIVLWLNGGPSQLETFDPKPGTKIGGPTKAIKTRVPGIEIAEDFPALADSMDQVALIRSVVTPEGEHERGTYYLRTGYRPAPSVDYPSLGAVFAHELAASDLDIPAHVAIDPTFGPPRGGLLGSSYDAFAIGDPKSPLPDVISRVKPERLDERAKDLAVLEGAFAEGHPAAKSLNHEALAERARSTMTSPRLKAFDFREEPAELIRRYGDTSFGRGCLVARRLVQQGVRAVEVTCGSWDSHRNNFEVHRSLAKTLDPAFAALLADLKEKELLSSTLVVCMGEFGRTPAINRLDGRDHWPKGFSAVLAGRGVKGGTLVGETDPEGEKAPAEPVSPGDLFATIYKACGIDPEKQNVSPAGRPIALAEGKPVAKILV